MYFAFIMMMIIQLFETVVHVFPVTAYRGGDVSIAFHFSSSMQVIRFSGLDIGLSFNIFFYYFYRC